MVEATWSREHYLSRWLTPGFYLFGFNHVEAYEAIDAAPLNQRAWVAQERFLSPRILHFTREVLAWECHESYTHENYAVTSVDAGSIDPLLDPSCLKRVLNSLRWQGPDIDTILRSELFNGTRFGRQPSDGPNLLAENTIYQAWGQFLHDYSGDNLTKESDIFVALNGVADEVGGVMNDRLVAGLWEGRFIEDLCWRPTTRCERPTVWRAPSWSWASVKGPIYSAAKKRQLHWMREEDRLPHNMAGVVELKITTKPSGEVEQASVLLACRLMQASICVAPKSSSGIAFCTSGIWTEPYAQGPIARPDGAFVIGLDDPHAFQQHHDHKVVDVLVLVLLQRGPYADPPRELEGLCIVESTRQPGGFERIGYFEIHTETAILVRSAYDYTSERQIWLV